MKEIPKFYNCLEETKKEIINLLFQGVKKRNSKFHNLVFTNVDFNNYPEARTVVLRNFCTDEFIINIHSDSRSNKVSQLNKNKNVCLIFYDDQKKIQLRVRGIAEIDKSNKESWEKLSNWSRRCYLTTENPGMICEKPSSGFPTIFSNEAPSKEQSEEGFTNFTLIKVFINQIEWLYLASQGHRRALFEVSRKS